MGKKKRKARTAPEKPAPPRSNVARVGAGLALLLVGSVAVALVAQSRGERAGARTDRDPHRTERAPVVTTVPVPLSVEVIRRLPHDPEAFTQGLEAFEGRLFESTGLEGRSTLREVELETGRVIRRVAVSEDHFAEGLTRVGDELIQLTWKSGLALVYSRDRFEVTRRHAYQGEGWGLCYDGTRLVMSDGSAELTLRNPATFGVRGRVRVTKVGRPVRRLNELECVGDLVYANVWQTDEIVRIDLRSGQVTGTIDASGLLTMGESFSADVLNGIAHVPGTDRFLITGKLWPWMFEVRFVER